MRRAPQERTMTRDEFGVCLGKLFEHYPRLRTELGGSQATLVYWFEQLEPYTPEHFDKGLINLIRAYPGTPSLEAIVSALERAKQAYAQAVEEAERRAHFLDLKERDEFDMFWARFNAKMMQDGACRALVECALERKRRYEMLAQACPPLAADAMEAAASAGREADQLVQAGRYLDPETLDGNRRMGVIDGPWEKMLPRGADEEVVEVPSGQ